MKTILVIGNGFDLAHGLKTSYSDFMDSIPSNNSYLNVLLNILKLNRYSQWSDIEYAYFTLLNHFDNTNVLTEKFNFKNRFDSSTQLDANFEQLKGLLENYLLHEIEQNFEFLFVKHFCQNKCPLAV